MKRAEHAAHNHKFEKMGLFRQSRWWYRKIKGTANMGWMLPLPWYIHYNDVIMTDCVSNHQSHNCLLNPIRVMTYCSTVYSDANQSKHQSSASLAFELGIHRVPLNSPHKWPVTRKMFPFDDVIMHIIFRPYLYFLNNVHYSFKYSCTKNSHRRSLYIFF